MPGTKGKIRLELDKMESRAELEGNMRAVAPFLKPLPEGPAQLSGAKKPAEELTRFIAIGESGSVHFETKFVPSGTAETAQTQGFWERFRRNLAALPAGLGAPFMIFSIFLGKGNSERVNSSQEYRAKLAELDADLLKLENGVEEQGRRDAAQPGWRERISELQRELEGLQDRKETFIRDNYRWHELIPIDPTSFSWPATSKFFHPNYLKAQFRFGPREIFIAPGELTRTAEQALEEAYRGLHKAGETRELLHYSTAGHISKVSVEFLQDSARYGLSRPGSRVVLRLKFERPIGQFEPKISVPKSIDEGWVLPEQAASPGSFDEIIVTGQFIGEPGRFRISAMAPGGLDPMEITRLERQSEVLATGEVSQEWLELIQKDLGAEPGPPRTVSFRANLRHPELFSDNLIFMNAERGGFKDRLISQGVIRPRGKPIPIRIETHGLDAEGHEPASPDQVKQYVLMDFSENSSAAVLIATSDRAIAEQVHRSFLQTYEASGSPSQAVDWLLKKSPWAGKGLLAEVPSVETELE